MHETDAANDNDDDDCGGECVRTLVITMITFFCFKFFLFFVAQTLLEYIHCPFTIRISILTDTLAVEGRIVPATEQS